MTYQLAISPDFKPELISDWFIFNTWFQKEWGQSVHLELHQGFNEQHQALDDKKIDIIYANPYDMFRLVREEGFVAIAKPFQKPDEAIIASHIDSNIQSVDQLAAPLTIAQADSPDVNTIGMIMIEPADIDPAEIIIKDVPSYISVAKQLISGDAQIGFFLADAFNDLSRLVKKQLQPVISSQIHMIHHALLLSPNCKEHIEAVRKILLSMHQETRGNEILKGLGIEYWEPMEQEDAEFMVDLMDTLIT